MSSESPEVVASRPSTPTRTRSNPLALLLVLPLVVLAVNFVSLQLAMRNVITNDARNAGISVWVHYGYWVNPAELVYDVRGIAGATSMADVFRVFGQFASAIQQRQFDQVSLACKGGEKFIMDGEDYQKLGAAWGQENPMYLVRTFPAKLHRPDGTQPFPGYTGGWLGVLRGELEDFGKVHREWYMQELALNLPAPGIGD